MADDEHDPTRCPPCRGTGKVVSNKGGTRSELTCPWCGGTGRIQPGRNAQDPDGGDEPPAAA